MCVANTYVVSRWRRGDWYIWLRDVRKIVQRCFRDVTAQPACLILRTEIRSQDVKKAEKRHCHRLRAPFVLVIVRERILQVK